MKIRLKNKHTKSRLILTGFLSITNLDRPNQKLGICLIFITVLRVLWILNYVKITLCN